jgi:hypothetical protein
MKRATALPTYQSVEEFPVPEGIAVLDIDPETLQLATPSCPTTRREVFIQGSAPTEFCERHGGVMLTETPPVSWLQRIFGGNDNDEPEEPSSVPTPVKAVSAPVPGQPAAATVSPTPAPAGQPGATSPPAQQPAESTNEEKKPGVLDRIFGIFGK